jgi:ribosomal protein S12 methylthiotransferase
LNIYFVSLGCDKNTVDSEEMITALLDAGYRIVNDPEEADAIVVNTCAFIDQAKEESIETILEMAEYKKDRCKILVCTGCLAERYHEDIEKELPEVDVVVGTSAYDQLVDALDEEVHDMGLDEYFFGVIPDEYKKEVSDKDFSNSHDSIDPNTSMSEPQGERHENKKIEAMADVNRSPEPLIRRYNSSGGYRAYLKIAEGCDKCCTYCIIPKLRGHYRSTPMETLLKQAEYLADNGTRELILVAQETTLYGTDIYGKKMLHVLLHRLSEIEGIRWIRILYAYPEEIYDDLIEEMKTNTKVLHYLDMPVQHSTDHILKLMGRRTSHDDLVDIIRKLRTAMPDIALRTTLITGFPGETKQDVDELADFVRDARFTRLGIFTYSPEEDTPAVLLPNQIDDDLKNERRDRLMALQQQIDFEIEEDQVGKELDVIIEGYMPDDDIYIGRTYMDAPDVDGLVFVKADPDLQSGYIVPVRIEKAEGYDLYGTMV